MSAGNTQESTFTQSSLNSNTLLSAHDDATSNKS